MFLNSTTFQLEIEQRVRECKVNYMTAVLDFCSDNDIDPEEIKSLLTSNLKDKIKLSAMEEGYMKTESALPL